MDQVFHAGALIRTLTDWAYGLAPAIGGLMFMYHHLAGTTSGDEQTAAHHKRAQRNAIINTLIALSGTTLMRWGSQYVGK